MLVSQDRPGYLSAAASQSFFVTVDGPINTPLNDDGLGVNVLLAPEISNTMGVLDFVFEFIWYFSTHKSFATVAIVVNALQFSADTFEYFASANVCITPVPISA